MPNSNPATSGGSQMDRSVQLQQVEEVLQALWDEVLEDPKLHTEARDAGLDAALERSASPYRATRGEAQFDVATTILISVVGGLAKDALSALWIRYVWPRLQRRFGTALEPVPDGRAS